MLSNPQQPPSGLRQTRRQQLHRRQNSTPSAVEMMKSAGGQNNNLPNIAPHPQQQSHQPHMGRQHARVSHRRGMSLDTRRQFITAQHQQMASPTSLRQEFLTTGTVSPNTNSTGYNASQHVLQEAQQQRTARPGPLQQQQRQQQFTNLATDENYLISPHSTPQQQLQTYDAQCFDGLPSQYDIYNGNMNVAMQKNQGNFAQNMANSQDFELFPSSTLSTPTFMTFQESPSGAPGWTSEGETSSTRRSSRRISGGIMERVAKYETMGMEGPQRPITPPHQNANEYFPLTPMETPHNRTMKHGQRLQRFTEGYDESMEETVKPGRQGSNQRTKNVFDEMRRAAEAQAQAAVPTPPRPGSVQMSPYDIQPIPTPEFMNMNNMGVECMKIEHGMEVMTSSIEPTPDMSQHTTPATPALHNFPNAFDSKPDLYHPNMVSEWSSQHALFEQSSSRRASPHRRTESVASIASAASIASIDIEQTKTETGITLDDIHQYIQGPDPRDNKWVCVFEDCNKRFGRKENIKSHVQTHLNDRQYKCPSCHKCFVRQHDLKRHAKIHTGIKPYPCECGNSFARHDALTRHKQRGMCIGAFDGIVRKVVKRGRPRKNRPDMDLRKEKSARTRNKNKSTSSTSSQSGYSDSSAVNSPENMDNDFDMLDDIMDVSMGGTTMNPSGLAGTSSAPMPTMSPSEMAQNAPSPSAVSVHSYHSHMSQHSHMSHVSLLPEGGLIDPQQLPSLPASPAKSVASQYAEPPELSQSSSPPSCNRYFDLEPPSSVDDAAVLCMTSSAGDATAGVPSLAGIDGTDDDILLQFTNSDDSNMLMLSADSKFDEAFDSTVGMFGTSSADDMFFGSN